MVPYHSVANSCPQFLFTVSTFVSVTWYGIVVAQKQHTRLEPHLTISQRFFSRDHKCRRKLAEKRWCLVFVSCFFVVAIKVATHNNSNKQQHHPYLIIIIIMFGKYFHNNNYYNPNNNNDYYYDDDTDALSSSILVVDDYSWTEWIHAWMVEFHFRYHALTRNIVTLWNDSIVVATAVGHVTTRIVCKSIEIVLMLTYTTFVVGYAMTLSLVSVGMRWMAKLETTRKMKTTTTTTVGEKHKDVDIHKVDNDDIHLSRSNSSSNSSTSSSSRRQAVPVASDHSAAAASPPPSPETLPSIVAEDHEEEKEFVTFDQDHDDDDDNYNDNNEYDDAAAAAAVAKGLERFLEKHTTTTIRTTLHAPLQVEATTTTTTTVSESPCSPLPVVTLW